MDLIQYLANLKITISALAYLESTEKKIQHFNYLQATIGEFQTQFMNLDGLHDKTNTATIAEFQTQFLNSISSRKPTR